MEQQGLGPPFLCFTQGLLLLHAVALVVPALETVSLVDLCGQTLGGGGMVVRSHAESRRFYFVAEGTDCWLTMRAAAPRDQIQFQFHFFLVYNLAPGPAGPTGQSAAPTPSGPGSGRGPASRPCSLGSSVRFYDGDGPTAAPLGPPLCGTTIPGPVRSSGRSLTIRLVTRRQQPRVDFVGHFAAFRFGAQGGPVWSAGGSGGSWGSASGEIDSFSCIY
uniref:CUB domain-containing protein n=1 Tax=Ornithorhynchus anatinus TaxID=9258 RepID=A0A6I8N2J2_ORNAN